jgi:hypothetical protein
MLDEIKQLNLNPSEGLFMPLPPHASSLQFLAESYLKPHY